MIARLQTLLRRIRMTAKREERGQTEYEHQSLLPQAAMNEQLIAAHIPYFRRLGEEDRHRFLNRVHYFRQSKRFIFTGMEENEYMPVLISAAAIQLCFGLEDYRLDYFRHIYILPDAYSIPAYEGLYIGHVAPEGIYISWKHFLEGYADNTDNINVAIHEMAHALEFDNFLPGTDGDDEFRADFERFRSICGPLFVNVLLGKPGYLRQYAYHNLREFWAVSVEAFFENPAAFKFHMPELYEKVAAVLNQDPLVP